MLQTARFLLIFLLLAGIFSTAYLVQGGDDSCATNQECNNFIVAQRKMRPGIENKIKGRKIASKDYYLMKMDARKEKVVRSRYTRKTNVNEPKVNYRASFVAFNADYKGPRRHPPKNN